MEEIELVVRLNISYLGRHYAGWQLQPNALTVQEVIERALGEFTGQAIRIHGASRTDSGVHARRQSAHTHLDERWPLRAVVHGTNHLLPDDIRVLGADRMCDDFHARISALGKAYTYRLWRGRVVPPMIAHETAATYPSLDVEAMRGALRQLVGFHDFSAFAKSGGGHSQPFRRIYSASLDSDGGPAIRCRLTGSGFLRGMVRGIVGTVVDVGRGHRSASSIEELLDRGNRSLAGPCAPAHGLTLEKVFYGHRWQPLESYVG